VHALLLTALLVAGTAQSGPRVWIEFFATRPDGSPVRDLAPRDIELVVDGRPRPVRSLVLVDTAASDSAVPPPYATNAPEATGRTVILVVEDESIRGGQEQRTRDELTHLVSAFAPNDRLALVTVPYGGVRVDLTTRHDRVREAIRSLAGRAPRGQTASELACRSRRTLQALAGLFEGLAGRGPTIVVFVSTGLVGLTRDAPLLGPPGPCEISLTVFDEVAAAADTGRVQLYVAQPEEVMPETSGLDPSALSAALRVGLEHLAGIGGNRLLRFSRGDGGVLAAVARETAAYYRLAFDPEPAERNDAFHRTEVRTARREVTIRSRPRVRIARETERRATPAPQALVAEPQPRRDFELRAAAYVSRNEGDDRLKIVAAFEPADPAMRLTGAAAGLFDARGRLVARWTARKEELAQRPILTAFVERAGTYRLRAAAVDEAGRAAGVDAEVIAELGGTGPIRLSDLVLGVDRGTRFEPALEFGAGASAIAYLEIFDAPAGDLRATFEIAASPNGPAIASLPGTVLPGAGRRAATARLPIDRLPPGDYVVRAIVEAAGHPAGRVLRGLRKRG
jgi:VWFA-related protein